MITYLSLLQINISLFIENQLKFLFHGLRDGEFARVNSILITSAKDFT